MIHMDHIRSTTLPVSVEEYRKLTDDTTTPDLQVERKLLFLESLCQETIATVLDSVDINHKTSHHDAAK